MPRHRSLTLRKFVEAIEHTLIERYFTEKLRDAKLPIHIIMNIEAVEAFMADPRNVEAKGLVQEDFRKINDICEKAQSVLIRAYRHYGIHRDDRLTLQGLALKLFLDHPEAFDYAYAWYCYFHASTKMSHHRIPGDFSLTKKKLDSFLEKTKRWFKDLAKGDECIITHYDEEDSTVILIKHGNYVRTIAYWEEDRIEVRSFALRMKTYSSITRKKPFCP